MPFPDLPTPALLIDRAVVRRNLARVAKYAASHGLRLRPHTKTHKSLYLARLQMELGAAGLTVAKVGEAQVMATAGDDLLLAYPAADDRRSAALAELARKTTVRAAVDSRVAATALAEAARSASVTLGVLVDLDVGHHRTGVQSPADALELGQFIDRTPGLRLDGLMIYPGHLRCPAEEQMAGLAAVEALLAETLDLFRRHGLAAPIVSGGSTPTAFQSHLMPSLTEIRPGTYIFHDMNCVRERCATVEDCAARILCTVVSTAVPGQFVLDAGSKTLAMDGASDGSAGHGRAVEHPEAVIAKLTEEHAQVDARACSRRPRVGDRVTVIPNHVCPCVNLQDRAYLVHEGGDVEALVIDARGRVW